MAFTRKSKLRNDPFRRRAFRAVWGWFGLGKTSPVMVVVLSAAILFVGMFYVWTRMQLVQIGYEISGLENKNNELKNRKRELLLEIASLQSPRELETKAAKYGLVFPAMGKVVHVPE
ncbi:MAG TPA: septum formation initiator family protein [Desulfomonilaceae bacterium]|nr:septum formation initiator family protein [Desulfomonilaceae bacterium]